MSVQTLPTDTVYPNPLQPRTSFPIDGLEELAASVRHNGLLQPISVVHRPDSCGLWMIVAGERRWRAHRLAALPTIQANVVQMTDDEIAINAIVENLQRADMTPWEEAVAFQRMLDAGYTVESLAEKLGFKQPWRVSERTALLRLTPDNFGLLKQGHLTPSQGTELARHPPADQTILLRLIRDGKCESYTKLRDASDGILAGRAQAAMFSDEEAPAPSQAEAEKLSRLERRIEALIRVCNDGIVDNEIVVLKKINPQRAAVLVQQLSLIRQNLGQMERALQFSAAQASLLSA
jgi:ParB family transcriptional regulator, chromosome partitioning protein